MSCFFKLSCHKVAVAKHSKKVIMPITPFSFYQMEWAECLLYNSPLLIIAVLMVLCVVCVKLRASYPWTKGRLLLLMCVLIRAIIFSFFFVFIFLQYSLRYYCILRPPNRTLKTCLILIKQFNAVVPSPDAKHNVPNMLVVGDDP